MTGPRIELHRAALAHNVAKIRELLGPDVSLMFAVKSNAYGHGMDLIAPEVIAQGADELAVLDIHTGIAVRDVVPKAPLLAWLLEPSDNYVAASTHRLELGISTIEQLTMVAKSAPKTPLVVHLKVDTGLHRNGATANQWPEFFTVAAEMERAGVITVRALWSHLADTSIESSLSALSRLQDAATAARDAGLQPEILHLAASHGALEVPETRLDMVRFGILGYGVSPFDNQSAEDLGFRPVLTLLAPITRITEDTIFLGMGYQQGLLPPVTPGATIHVGHTALELVAVEADHTVLRGSFSLDGLHEGMMVPLMGANAPGASVEAWAGWTQTIGDEVLVRLHPDIPRYFSDTPSDS